MPSPLIIYSSWAIAAVIVAAIAVWVDRWHRGSRLHKDIIKEYERQRRLDQLLNR